MRAICLESLDQLQQITTEFFHNKLTSELASTLWQLQFLLWVIKKWCPSSDNPHPPLEFKLASFDATISIFLRPNSCKHRRIAWKGAQRNWGVLRNSEQRLHRSRNSLQKSWGRFSKHASGELLLQSDQLLPFLGCSLTRALCRETSRSLLRAFGKRSKSRTETRWMSLLLRGWFGMHSLGVAAHPYLRRSKTLNLLAKPRTGNQRPKP